MRIKSCRNCKKTKFINLFSLGKMSFTGRFPKSSKTNIPKEQLNLLMCNFCKLVQLDRNFNLKYLYGKNYGYRTGMNHTMTNHVKKTVKKLSSLVKLKKKDYVLDIASNDSTLLNFYPNNVIKVGVDPLVNKYIQYYKKINFKISNFFNLTDIKKLKLKKKFKIITALSVFYDLRDPNKFIREIKEILDDQGIIVLEHVDLHCIIKHKIFDTICHEHLGFFSSKVIIDMVKKNKLKVFAHEYNNVNGGSSRYYISHIRSKYIIKKSVKKALINEKKTGIFKKTTYKLFYKRIVDAKLRLIEKLKSIKSKNLIVHGYGASTKGNVLLQFFNIGKNYIQYIADRNPLKFNSFTPGTKIKIISEKKSRAMKPDYYLVLPWHFKKEILSREKKIMNNGTKIIFPLPKLEIK